MCKENAFGIFADGYIEDIKKIDEMVLLMHYKNIIKHSKSRNIYDRRKTTKK